MKEEIIISFSDMKRIFFRIRPKLKTAALVCGFAAFSLLLFKQPLFVSEATFKQGASAHENNLQLRDFFQAFGSRGPTEASTVSMMMSRSLLRDVVEELGLQVQWDRQFRLTELLSRVWENIAIELGRPLSDVDTFAFRSVRYEAEKGKTLFIKVLTDNSFKLLDENQRELGKWNLNEPISLPFFSGKLVNIPANTSANKVYRLNVSPWLSIVGEVKKRFAIKPIKSERNLFTLIFADRDRHLAAKFVNQAMASCQKLIRSENEEIVSAQLAYLEKRQEELTRKWDGSLQEHVAYLKSNLDSGGFLSFLQELDTLQEPQNDYSTRLLTVDFELSRLESQDIKRPPVHDSLLGLEQTASQNETPFILEQHKHTIDQQLLALEFDQNKIESEPLLASPALSDSGMAGELADLSRKQQEAEDALQQLENGEEIALLHDPKSLASIWARQVARDQQNQHLATHLHSFIDQTGVKMKNLQENMTLHASSANEFAGLTLNTAQNLYLEYNNQRDALQSQLKQLIYLSEQLYNPQFELSSITTILTDSVTNGLVVKAGETSVRLQDANNRSQREQEHLKETLLTQKAFIAQHLSQIIELTKLRAKLAEDKIISLRKTNIHLLKQEKQLLQQQLEQISHKMEDLPEKWRRENVLKLKKELGMKMVEGLTELMESKSIDRHLYQVGSKPLDKALAPTAPKKPKLLLFSLIAAILGAIGFYFYHFSRSLITGMPVAHDTLLLSGFNSCGVLSSYSNVPVGQMAHPDLETLRRLVQFLTGLDQPGLICPIIGGKNPDFAPALAELLAMQQKRVLVVQYVFDKPVSPDQVPGLWQYLHSEVPSCPVKHHLTYDFLPSGGTSRHSVEMLSNPKLAAFLASAKSHYDIILFYSSAQPAHTEGHALLNIADAMIVATKEEKKEDLFIYQAWSLAKEKNCVAFVDMS